MFRLSLVGFCGLFVMMHLTAVACFLTTHANSHRESEVLEPLESMQAQAPSWARFRELLRVGCAEARHREELMIKHALGQKESN